jgi:pilus assembly protein CpaE
MHMNDLADRRMAASLKVAMLSPAASSVTLVRDMLLAWDSSLRPSLVCGPLEQVHRMAQQEHPDVLLVEGAAHERDELSALERLTAEHPALAVILLSANQSAEYLRHAMRIGIREVLPLPLSREALIEALGRLRQRLGNVSGPKAKGKIVSFVGCKGGSGATFLAANFAYLLSETAGKKVALIDLNCQLGDAALYVTHRNPACTLADVAQHIDRLDAALLVSSMIQVQPNFHLLPAPEEPEQALHIRAEHVDPLLAVAAGYYDFVVIDAGRSLDGVSVRAMDHSDTIYAVLQLNLPFLRDAKRLLSALAALGYGKEKIQLLVNRFDSKSPISLADVAETLHHDVVKTIPNSFDAVAASVNQGEPICRLSPRNVVARALRELASLLNPQPKASGWLRGMLAKT